MSCYYKSSVFVALILYSTQNVITENVDLNSTDTIEGRDAAGRRGHGILIMDNSANGHHLTSQNFETKTYTSSMSTSGSAGSGGLRGWVSESQNAGNVVLQPQIQGIIQNQQGCAVDAGENILTNGGQYMHKKSTLENSQYLNDGSSIDSFTSNQKQWHSGQNGMRVGTAALGQLGSQFSVLHGSSSQVSTNNANDLTGTIITSNAQGLNTLYDGVENTKRDENVFYPHNYNYKVSLVASGDGIYANELTGLHAHNLNLKVPMESNAANIVAVPIMRPQFGRTIVQGYRPNIQYYLSQIEESNMMKNPLTIFRVPSFIERIKPDQMNVNLSEEQLNNYRQYLIQTGLIKLKPYQLIFSDQFRPMLRTLQWMVVPLESNWEYCRQRCGNIFARNTLYSTLADNASKLPLKLLVPVLKVRNGLTKTVAGAQTIAGGVGDMSEGVFRMMKDSPSHVSGLLKENSEEKKNKS